MVTVSAEIGADSTEPTARRFAATIVPAVPVAVLTAAAWALAWQGGSIDAGDWLPYAVLAAVVSAAVLFSGFAARPSGLVLGGIIALLGLAGWTAISLTWSPVPALARDEALLTAFYAIALAVPLLTLRTDAGRLAAVAVVAGGVAALSVANAIELVASPHRGDLYFEGRLSAPIGYPNAQAAMFLVALWPAIALAARRTLPPAARALALGGTVALAAGWLLTQSKGGGVGLAVSALVFFAVTDRRLRALVPLLLTAAFVAPAYLPLTAPFRAHGQAATDDAIRNAGLTALVLTAGAVAVGLLYALLDRRIEVSAGARRLAGVVAVASLATACAGGVAAFFVVEGRPGHVLAKQWREFKRPPNVESGTSHFVNLGSIRYDMWRLALQEFEAHPLNGMGGRGFAIAYLEKGDYERTPQRSHSLELDALSETGLVGFALLAAGLGLPLVAVARRARRSLEAAALLAAAVYWLAHASVDWIWTVPAATLPFFLLLGIAASPGGRRLGGRVAAGGGIAALLVAALAFVPPWLAARYVDDAYARGADWRADVRHARDLDPLSVDPLVAKAVLTPNRREAIAALEEAVRMQPRSAELRLLLGNDYLKAGRRGAARKTLLVGHRLDPRDHFIADALERARGRR